MVAFGTPEDVIRDAFAVEAAAGIDVVIDYLRGRATELLLEALAKDFQASSTRATRLGGGGPKRGQGDQPARIDLASN